MQAIDIKPALYTILALMQPSYGAHALDYTEQAIRMLPAHPREAALHLLVATTQEDLKTDPRRAIPFLLIGKVIRSYLYPVAGQLTDASLIEATS